MQTYDAASGREARTVRHDADLVVVGGGLAGVCCAITAARAGLKVTLVQDRPVLGGNASSEVRLWVLGATSHLGNNNRWAREGGVIDEILVENLYRNREGNPLIVDTILLEKVLEEPGITLLLNTAAYEVERGEAERGEADTIRSVRAFCSQNSTSYDLRAPLFCDCSGDGVVGFLSGAAFRIGAESRSEFGERLAPAESNEQLLGHSLYFYTRDTGRPVRFVRPSYALRDITQIPRYRQFNTKEHGCLLWWIEYGGVLDTVHDTERIKWELWKIVYGVWDHIKNSGEFPESENLTLEWVGAIPGKRESRRFEGDYMLQQQDIVEQRTHYDAVSFGGWAIDLHPSEGVYSAEAPCTQWHARGVYQIPYRTMYSRNVPNLFLAGRILSASHVAFGSTRVMATCAHNAQAVALAAAMCVERGLCPRDIAHPDRVAELQRRLLREGQHIPGVELQDASDLAREARVTASSEQTLAALKPSGRYVALDAARALLLPLGAGRPPAFEFQVRAKKPTRLTFELRVSDRLGSYTPDRVLETVVVELDPNGSDEPQDGAYHSNGDASPPLPEVASNGNGASRSGELAVVVAAPTEAERPRVAGAPQTARVAFSATLTESQYAFVCLLENADVEVAASDELCTGVTTVVRRFNRAVAKSVRQSPPEGSGIESFEFWTPERRPKGKNLAFTADGPIGAFGPERLCNGFRRPGRDANAWVAAPRDPEPTVDLTWDAPRRIGRVELVFDSDPDHPMETVLLGHSDSVAPCRVREYKLLDARDRVVHQSARGHQTRETVRFDEPIVTERLRIVLGAPDAEAPAALYEVRCYAE